MFRLSLIYDFALLDLTKRKNGRVLELHSRRFPMRFQTSAYLVLAVGLLTVSVQSVSAAVQTNIKVPVNIGVFVPCAADGAGEVVFLTGDLHVLLRFTMDQAGGIHAASHFQPQGISGNGQTTGDKYQASGVTQDEFNAKVGSEETFINNFRVVGQGPGNNFLIHENFHVTFNANGVPTAFVDNFSVDCR
jgi:hypothetical protein